MRPLHNTSVNKGLSVLTSLCSWAIGHWCTTMPVWGSYTCSTCFCGSSPPYSCLPVRGFALPSMARWTCCSLECATKRLGSSPQRLSAAFRTNQAASAAFTSCPRDAQREVLTEQEEGNWRRTVEMWLLVRKLVNVSLS